MDDQIYIEVRPVSEEDYDFQGALEAQRWKDNPDILGWVDTPEYLGMKDVIGIAACVPGQNDELDWYWIVRVRNHDKPWALIQAWCDYTGWGCQDGADVSYHSDALEAALAVYKEASSVYDDFRPVVDSLIGQLTGETPYGVVVIYPD